MIKNRAEYSKNDALKRRKYLQALTYQRSAAILEQMLDTPLVSELHFSQDDAPIALYKRAERKK